MNFIYFYFSLKKITIQNAPRNVKHAAMLIHVLYAPQEPI